MKIDNYDSEKSSKDIKRKLVDFISEDYRMLICGPSGCGKTKVLMHILQKPIVIYDKVYIYTKFPEQDKYEKYREIMRPISDRVGYEIVEIFGGDEIKTTTEYPKKCRKIVIFDDLVGENDKVQKLISDHFTQGRHCNISPIYLSQGYHETPKMVRKNCSHLALFDPDNMTHRNLITRENNFNPEIFPCLQKYDFAFVDRIKKSVKKNFDEII